MATAEMEAEVQAFLRQHHPELAQVLAHLQSNLPHEYDRAVRDLSRVLERLSQMAERDPLRYQWELKAWVVESHIHLTVARLAMGDSLSLREELRQLLDQQFEVKLETLRHDRERQAERLRKMDEQIEKMSAGREQLVHKQFLSLTKSSESMAVKAGVRNRPKKPADVPLSRP